MINAIVDGTTYTGIDTITTGGKTINLEQIGGEGLPEGIGEIKISTYTQENNTSSTKVLPHGCSVTPDIVIITSDYKTHYTDEVKAANSIIVAEFYDGASGYKSYATVPSGYAGGINTNIGYSATLSSTNDGYITAVDETNVTINSVNNKRIGGGLVYTMYAIVLDT